MKAIWKYRLPIRGVVDIDAYAEFKPLSVGLDRDDELTLWALVETESMDYSHRFHVVFTGQKLPVSSSLNEDGVDRWKFIGSVTLKNGLVSHVFQE